LARSPSIRPSLNLKALLAETEPGSDDNWMISYIDVFVLMTTIFVMLLVLNTPQLGVAPLSTENSTENPAERVSDGVESKDVEPKERESLVERVSMDPPSRASTEVTRQDQRWLDSIAASIKQHGLGELIQLKEDADFTELQIQSRVLFDSGESELTRSGVSVLEKLMPVLKASEGLIFVEGHTDNRPIGTARFRSNWDLASARATEVLQFFVAEGMSGERFRAVSYGDTKPLVANDTVRNRRKNRRVSLMIQRQSL